MLTKNTLFLDGVQVSNQKLIENGFSFEYSNLEKALDQIL
jgi:NAD dependent epimerase/dehydratase family enzyme